MHIYIHIIDIFMIMLFGFVKRLLCIISKSSQRRKQELVYSFSQSHFCISTYQYEFYLLRVNQTGFLCIMKRFNIFGN